MTELSIDRARRLVRITPGGQLNADSGLRLFRQMLEHPDFEPGMSSVWDLRQCDVSAMNAESFRAIADYSAQRAKDRGTARVAYVSDTNFAFGLSRMFEVVGKVAHLETRAFRDIASAEAWVLEPDAS